MSKPLVIGVDIRDLRVAKTGTQTYLTELCREFKKLESAELQFRFIDTSFPIYRGQNKLLKWIEHLKYQLWKQVTLPIKAWYRHCDIVFCTDNFVPLVKLGYQTIPVFHDAFFFEMPLNYGKLWLWLYKKTALPAATRSAFVITPTAYAKKQIAHYTHIPNGQLIVVPEGPKTLDDTAKESNLHLFSKYAIKPDNYILHVGSMFKRKNIPALVHAFNLLKEQGYSDLQLVLAGPLPSTQLENDYAVVNDAINSSPNKQNIIITGYLPDADLAQLYKSALVYVFPSINEGFGIPVLEAFRFGLPVLVANNTCLPEVGGDAVVTFDPYDVEDIALKTKTVLNDAALQKTMISKGYERLKYYNWNTAAIKLVEVFRRAANN